MTGSYRQWTASDIEDSGFFLSMNEARLRAILRWIHIILGLAIMCYVYSPWAANAPFQIFIKIIVVPAGALTGVWIWKFAAFNRLLRRKN